MLHISAIDDHMPFLDLLLLADPSRELVESYAKTGHVYGAMQGGVPVGVYVLVALSADIFELKNIAVEPSHHRQGIGHKLLAHAEGEARTLGASALEVGTGDAGAGQLAFYENAGFQRVRTDKGFFLRNYAEPVMENGLQHKDMIFLAKTLDEAS